MGGFAYAVGYVLWPPAITLQYTGYESLFSNLFYLFEALAFGWGISFMIWILPRLKLVAEERWMNGKVTALAVGWLLLSWWPHDRLHLMSYESIQSFLYIEYGFHIPTIVAVFVIAYYSSKFIAVFAKAQNKTIKSACDA